MKTHSNNFLKRSVVGLSMLGLVVNLIPVANVHAADRSDFTSPFCRNIDSLGAKALGRIDERIDRIDERLANQDKRFDEKTDSIDKRRSDKRSEWDKKRDDAYAKLAARADTDAEKAAVSEFEKTMDTAVATRRSAVDKAVAEFRKGLETSIDTRHDGIDGATTKFKNAINAAVTAATTACNGKEDAQSIRTDFRASVKAARATLKSDIQSLEKVKTDRQALAKTRNAAVQSAVDTFKATAEKARADLKAAFGK